MKDIYSTLPIFVAVIENKSFSAAADALGMTKSAVSKRIAVLESNIGVRLFTRTTRSLTLTEAGEKLADYAQSSLNLAKEGFAAVTHLQNRPKGTLKINAPMSFSRLHLIPFMKAFLDQYPDIKINLSMNDAVTSLTEGGFDIGIRIGELQDSSLIARKIVACKSVICASPEYLKHNKAPQVPEDLEKHNCLYYSLFQAGTEWTFYKEKNTTKVHPKGNFTVNNSEAISDLLLQGLGIAQMPTFIVANALKSGELIPLLENYQLPNHAIYAVYPERKHLPEKVNVFIQFLQNRLGTGSGYWDL